MYELILFIKFYKINQQIKQDQIISNINRVNIQKQIQVLLYLDYQLKEEFYSQFITFYTLLSLINFISVNLIQNYSSIINPPYHNKMAQHNQQQYEPIFSIDNKYVIKGWQKVNPKNKLPSITKQKLQAFLKYVFDKSKDQLQMQLDQNTNFLQMIQDFLQQSQQTNKNTFTLEQAVDILNWAVDPGDQEQQEEQQQHHQQPQKQPVKNQKPIQKQPIKNQQPQQRAKQKQQQKPPVVKQEPIQNKQKVPAKNSTKQPQQQQKIQKQQPHQNMQKDHNNGPIKQAHKQSHINQQKHQVKKVEEQKPKQHKQKQVQQTKQNKAAPKSQQHHTVKPQKQEINKKQQTKNVNIQNKGSDRKSNKQKNQINHNDSNKKMQQSKNQHEMDWGKVQKPQQKVNNKLYKQISSYLQIPQKCQRSTKQYQRQVNFEQTQQNNDEVQKYQHQQKTYVKKPLSIKRSLAKLNKSQVKKKQHKTPLPVLKLSPNARQMKYIKKQKIVIKNKKPKPQYHPQNTGLKELFKFYCSLNSQFYNMSKHKDPAKGTFDQLQNRISNLYMHNFMLICKDFNIIQNKNNLKTNGRSTTVHNEQKQMNQANHNEPSMKKRNSKGSVPGTTVLQDDKIQKKNQNKKPSNVQKNKIKKQSRQKIQVWDRDGLSNYFKKEADYTLNVKFDKFLQIMKYILKDKLVIQDIQPKAEQKQNKQNLGNQKNTHKKQTQQPNQNQTTIKSSQNKKQTSHDSKDKQQDQQEKVKQANTKNQQQQSNINPQTMALCRFFRLQNQSAYEETFKKLKIIYKIMQPQTITLPQKKVIRQQNGQFPQNVAQALKNRQLQKQKHRIQVKQKYLNKFSAPQVDVYSSFKTATNQSNSLNALYGSGPKLVTNKSSKLATISEGTYQINTIDYDGNSKKKNSGQYTLNIGSVIKQARNQISQANKQNRQSHRLKQHSNTQNLAKSRFNPLSNIQTSQKQQIGYKKLHDLRQQKQDEQTLSSILLNNSRMIEGNKTNRSQKTKLKSKDISSPLLQRMGCHEDDDLLNKYFDQEKSIEKSQLGTIRI